MHHLMSEIGVETRPGLLVGGDGRSWTEPVK